MGGVSITSRCWQTDIQISRNYAGAADFCQRPNEKFLLNLQSIGDQQVDRGILEGEIEDHRTGSSDNEAKCRIRIAGGSPRGINAVTS